MVVKRSLQSGPEHFRLGYTEQHRKTPVPVDWMQCRNLDVSNRPKWAEWSVQQPLDSPRRKWILRFLGTNDQSWLDPVLKQLQITACSNLNKKNKKKRLEQISWFMLKKSVSISLAKFSPDGMQCSNSPESTKWFAQLWAPWLNLVSRTRWPTPCLSL